MDPLTGASAFASIVGLICNFRSERQSKGQDDYNDFLLWLDRKKHEEIISEINSNHLLGLGVKSLLNDNHDQVMAKLKALETSMASVSAHISGLKEISEALTPNNALSEQAFSIIKQLSDSGGSFFLELKMYGGALYQVMDASGRIEIDEPRFVNDDLSKLCELGLLIPDRNKKGERLFRFTRAAESLVKASEL
jgi:hypothetical protein